MKNGSLLFCSVLLFVVVGCSSGKKAYEKGDYYDAVAKAVARLKQKPDHSKSKETLKNAYPLAVQNLEQDAQNIMASNDMFKHRNTIRIYNQINSLCELVKSSPAALTVIRNPKNYYNEIGAFKEKASEELYTAGIQSMLKGSRHDARQAYFYFQECESYVPRYKEALEMMTQSEKDATLNVMWEETIYDRWTNPDNVIAQLDDIQFVDVIHKDVGIKQADKKFDLNMLVTVQKYTESEPKITKKEQEITDSVKVGEKVVNNVKVPTYQKIKGKYVRYEKKVTSRGTVSVTVHDKTTGNIVMSKQFEGSGQWSGSWARCSGDSRVFSKSQKENCDNEEPKPGSSQLKEQANQEVLKAMYAELSGFLRNY